MRAVDWRLVPAGGALALLTMEDLVDGEPLMMADFRDVRALFHKETGRFVGLARDTGVRLGRPPIRLKDGIWYLIEDLELGRSRRNVPITSDTASLELIELAR
jgi:hypothetical protein